MPLTSVLQDALNTDKPNLRAWLAARAIVSVLDQDYGAVGDGVANDGPAFDLAFAEDGKAVWLPKGLYKVVTDGLAVPTCAEIYGEGDLHSIIMAAGVGEAVLPLNLNTTLRDFGITGDSTANAIGIVFGQTTGSKYAVENVRILDFDGTAAIGCHFKNCLKSQFDNLTIAGCTRDALIEGTGGLPTTLTFNNLYAGTATGVGVDILNGNSITFNDSQYESNGAEGVKIRPNTVDATEIVFNGGWFEGNYGNTANQYHCTVNPDGRTARPIFNNVFFGAGARALHLTQTGVGSTRAIINNLIIDSVANAVVCDSGATAKVIEWGNTDPSVTLTDPDGGVSGAGNLPWPAWTPVYGSFFSAVLQDQAATFNGAVATVLARYQLNGKTLTVSINFAGTLNAVTPTYLTLTMPAGLLGRHVGAYSSNVIVKNNSVYETGISRTDGDALIFIYRPNFAAFTSATAIEVFGTFIIEVL